jgi:hypothetical protein
VPGCFQFGGKRRVPARGHASERFNRQSRPDGRAQAVDEDAIRGIEKDKLEIGPGLSDILKLTSRIAPELAMNAFGKPVRAMLAQDSRTVPLTFQAKYPDREPDSRGLAAGTMAAGCGAVSDAFPAPGNQIMAWLKTTLFGAISVGSISALR